MRGQAESAHARRLLDRISEVFVSSGNVYESYDMAGHLGGDPGSNYLEHCGGFAWALTEGLFGLELFSDPEAAATVRDPLARMDPSWGDGAVAQFVLRGTAVALKVNPRAGTVSITGVGPKVIVRMVRGRKAKLVCVGSDCPSAKTTQL